MSLDERYEQSGTVVAFRLQQPLVDKLDALAAYEGLSRAAYARRAILTNLRATAAASEGGRP